MYQTSNVEREEINEPRGNSPAVQCLELSTLTAGAQDSIPDQVTKDP